MATHPATTKTMTYEQFRAWGDDTTHAEWVALDAAGNGEVIIHMPPKWTHQAMLDFLSKVIGLYVRLFDLGRLGFAPFEVRLPTSAREPDLFFVATANLDRFTEDRLEGPPDLIIEIISRSSVKIDRDDKYKEYRDAGVREYWVIDPRPDHHRADFYRLADGEYRLVATEEDERVESSVLPEFWLKPEWLWQAESLEPLQICAEIVGDPQIIIDYMTRKDS